MADQPSGEKSEEPTSKRLSDAREKGQVAKSTDVVTTVSTFFVLETIYLTLGDIYKSLIKFFDAVFLAISSPNNNSMLNMLELSIPQLISSMYPVCIVAAIAVIIANVGQFGFLFSLDPLKPDINKISPMSGFKKIFSMKTLFELVKSTIKLSIFGILLCFIISKSIGPLATLPFATLMNSLDVVQPMLLNFIGSFMAIYVVIALFDFIIQKKLLLKELRMTKDETKREMHDMEGDPQIKGNRRRLQREMIFEDTSTATRKSTVLVTNPTHYAAAIYYERGKTPLPVLRAKGSGFIALRMISVAREENIPIVENVPLARALYNELEVNDIIPKSLLEPVTEILRWVRTLPPRVAE
ncbi:MAG: EscU/YscU/HrcU family type III secretion system export apparatus switch protein [Verrucomicrobia bacterium]|nr:MAG: EscU/YscU/HrcU family type III secretion system export apparatus switch protein [Verrucomicrobiota bacterium]